MILGRLWVSDAEARASLINKLNAAELRVGACSSCMDAYECYNLLCNMARKPETTPNSNDSLANNALHAARILSATDFSGFLLLRHQ